MAEHHAERQPEMLDTAVKVTLQEVEAPNEPDIVGSLVFSEVEKYCIVNWLCHPVPATTF